MVGILLYGSGLRLLEALQLRVKDVDFAELSLKRPVDPEPIILKFSLN